MDTTTAGIRPNLIYSALVNVLEMISFGLVILVKSVLSFVRFINQHLVSVAYPNPG